MTQDDRTPERSEQAIAALLAAHGRKKGLEHVEDDAAQALQVEALADAPDWHKEGKPAPHGWHVAGDTFEED